MKPFFGDRVRHTERKLSRNPAADDDVVIFFKIYVFWFHTLGGWIGPPIFHNPMTFLIDG